MSYLDTGVFILCFDVSNEPQFSDIHTYWAPELSELCPHTPIILVGTKTDLREKQVETSSCEAGESMAARINAVRYMEVS